MNSLGCLCVTAVGDGSPRRRRRFVSDIRATLLQPKRKKRRGPCANPSPPALSPEYREEGAKTTAATTEARVVLVP